MLRYKEEIMNFMTRSGITAIPVLAIIFILQGCGGSNGISGIYENKISTLTLKNDGTFTYRLQNTEYDGSYRIEGETIIAKETKNGKLSTIVKNSKDNNVLCLSEESANNFYQGRMCWQKKK
jgi:hypothetical protein